MSRPPLSDAQRRAVEFDLADTCVTAGAGSGKTRVLAERYVQLVMRHDLRVRDVAALTFTEKAAAEMRERIAAYFEAAGNEAARADVEFAPISTIHAFCARLLRLHAIEAGVDPQFAMLDAGEAQLLREDATLRAESRLRVEAPDAFLAYQVLPRSNTRGLLMDVLESLRGAGVAPADLEWIPAALTAAEARAGIEGALPDVEAFLATVKPEQRLILDEALADVRAMLAEPETSGDDIEYAAFWALRVADAIGQLKMIRKKGFASARTALSEAVGQLGALRLNQYAGERVLPALRTVLTTFDTAYRELKRERSALDFTDLELEALALLDRLAARERVPDLAPKALLVDEFQDTNPLQARILDRLRAAAPQFSVGDPKQSIYRFRRADVGVIVTERDRVGEDARHELATSYRAHPELVLRINALNALMFAGDAAGVPYEALEAGADFAPTSANPLRFTLVDAGDDADADLARAAEARWIAETIRGLVDGKVARTKAGSEGTPITFGDVAILFRSRKSIGIYESALAAAGVPSLTLKGQGYLESDEIRDLVYLLRVVQNPADEFALACVATGPVLAGGDADLLRWFRPDKDGGAWERICAESAEGGPLAGPVAAIERLRRLAALGPIASVVEGALDALGLLESALVMDGGARRAANLRKAVALARRMDRVGERDLGDLLRRLASLREREVGESEAAVGGLDADVVRLTTVHSAKGLEYPIVFLADVGRKKGGTAPDFHVDDQGRVAIKIMDPLEGNARKPDGYLTAAAGDALAEGREDRRVFYVATTRAEERLYLSAWCKGANKGDGQPTDLSGWGKLLWSQLGVPFTPGECEAAIGETTMHVEVIEAEAAEDASEGSPDDGGPVVASADDVTEARRLLDHAQRATAPLGGTRFVVTVSELLSFAASPPQFYADVHLLRARRPRATAAPVLSAHEESDPALAVDDRDDAATRHAERVEGWDEPSDTHGAIDRSGVGRAVHRVIERMGGAPAAELAIEVARAIREETGGAGPAGMAEMVADMAERFARSETGAATQRALEAGLPVRRELDFHARLRFPGGEPVAGYDSLLVKGSIDLWLPTDDGVLIVDHKTNRRSAYFPTPESVGAHYRWQLCLYAAAAERLTGADVAGARLLLLDPSWGAEAVEVAVDVSGEALREARALCRAFAIAELEGRYPSDWRRLLA